MSSVPRAIFDQVKKLIPPLDGSLHKGQSGRVGVLGGAMDYTGAPYFAAISALRLGADLSHVICSPTAAGAIKTYAPDLIVHPMLEENSTPDAIKPALQSLLSRLHVLIIGPGLGREPYMQSYAALALQLARERGMFVVLDADGLYLVGQDSPLNPQFKLIKGYRRAVLTPNVVEFSRLCHQLSVDPTTPGEDRARDVSWRLGGVTVLEKGREDTVAVDSTRSDADSESSQEKSLEDSGLGGADKDWEKAKEKVIVDVQGGMKRVGGQGDVLSGSVGAFLAWGKCYEDGVFGKNEIPVSRIPLLAAVGASMVARTTSRLAYQSVGRSMITADMLPLIGKAFQEVFDEHPGQTKGKM